MNTETASVSSSGTALRVQAPNSWSDPARHLALCSIVLLAGCASNMHAGYDGLCLDAAYPSGNSTKVIACRRPFPLRALYIRTITRPM
jgi:hypothetical protein